MINVLFVCTDWYSVEGSTESLVNLISATRGTVSPIVLLNGHGKVEEYLLGQGIETMVSPFFFLWEKPKRLLTALHHPTRTVLYRRLTLNKKCCDEIARKLGARKIDIVHSNTTATDLGVRLAHKLGAKHVWHVRESLLMLGIHPCGGMQRLCRLINKADARIVISAALANHWELASDNTFTLHDAVLKEMPVLTEQARTRTVLFCAAQINDFKGAPLAVEAFCKSGLENYRLCFVGDCPDDYRVHLLGIAQQYGKNDCLEFEGFQTPLEPYFRSASAFLMCSRFEGLGRVTVEAMAYGCPVVAKASGGTTDFVKQGVTGYLFNDVDECVEMLQLAVNHDDSIVRAAYNMVSSTFTEECYGIRIQEIYNKCLQRSLS